MCSSSLTKFPNNVKKKQSPTEATTNFRREIESPKKIPEVNRTLEEFGVSTRRSGTLQDNIALKNSLDDLEKKHDHVKLSLNRSESQVKRLSQHIWELLETVNVLLEAGEFTDPQLAFSESGRNHVSGANFLKSHCC